MSNIIFKKRLPKLGCRHICTADAGRNTIKACRRRKNYKIRRTQASSKTDQVYLLFRSEPSCGFLVYQWRYDFIYVTSLAWLGYGMVVWASRTPYSSYFRIVQNFSLLTHPYTTLNTELWKQNSKVQSQYSFLSKRVPFSQLWAPDNFIW